MTASHPKKSPRRFCFVFVCQSGELEVKALLLAASLKRFLRCDYELVAAVPMPMDVWGELSPTTIDVLRRIGVRVEAIENPIDVRYPIGNKLACLTIGTTADKIVFLDSDILCLREFFDSDVFDVAFAAKPADLRTFAASSDVWEPLYASVGVDVPTLRLPTTVSGEFGLAYFNSGVVFADVSVRLGQAWIDCARAIDGVPSMQPQRHWLDQVSLAVAVHKQKLGYSSLGEAFNFPAHLKPIGDDVPFFCHYHWPKVLRSEPRMMELFASLVAEFPEIAQLAEKFDEWSKLLRFSADAKTSRNSYGRDQIIVAGIPSVTDRILCDLMSQHDNCLVVRHVNPLDATLRNASPPWEIAASMRNVRDDVVAGDGEFSKGHSVLEDDFVLVASSPLGFLTRLPETTRVLPSARIVVCIDSPFSTIADWKVGDIALRDADLTALGLLDAPWLSALASVYLNAIAAQPSASSRRAMLWWWLAQCVLSNVDRVTVVTADALRFRQQETLRQIFDGMRPGQLRQPMHSVTSQDEILSDEDCQAIRAICAQPASELGVWM